MPSPGWFWIACEIPRFPGSEDLYTGSTLLLYLSLPGVSFASAKRAVSGEGAGRKQMMGVVEKKFQDWSSFYIFSLFSFHRAKIFNLFRITQINVYFGSYLANLIVSEK